MLILSHLIAVGKESVKKCSKKSCQAFWSITARIPCNKSWCCNFPQVFSVHQLTCCHWPATTKYGVLKSCRQMSHPSKADENSIIDQYKSYYYSKSKNNLCDALFVLGPMGSGKTTIVKEKIMTHARYGKYAYVDTDEVMAHLPGFNENKIDLFYPAARRIAIALTDWLLEEQLSFVAEGTCVKYQELIDYMVRLKEKGYKIKVCKINNLPLDVVLKRASQRVHRKIPANLVEEIFLQSNHGIFKIYESNKDNRLFENINVDDF